MGKIKILSPSVANKIAAGEVVERPASVVKELVENAVDAEATQITINVEKGGVKKIQVFDNGSGMDKEDLQNCIRRHGTSKIKTEEDLLHVKSMGFRGEALSSIAAVSRMVVESKTKGEVAGNAIEIEGGVIQSTRPAGRPMGTSVTVKDLFYNVPARKKFLKSTVTEFRHISNVIVNNALAFPAISFTLRHNGKIVIDLPPNQDLLTRIDELLGRQLQQNLIEVFFDHPQLKVKGFIAKPQLAGETTAKQYIFVNQRRVKDRTTAAAACEAYGTLLPPKARPLFILFLKLPYELVDVNVHPRKEEIRFVQQNFVFNAVKGAIANALTKKDLTFVKQFSPTETPPAKISTGVSRNGGVTSRKYQKDEEYKDRSAQEFLRQVLPWETEELRTQLERKREILQIHKLYLVTETDAGLLIVDQHAAHERILYEKLLAEFKKEKRQRNVQPLLVAETIDLSLSDAAVLDENLVTLQKLGFELTPFGKNSFRLEAVPAVLKECNAAALISETIEDLKEGKELRDIDQKSLRAISFLSCRSAVKAGDSLGSEERQNILAELQKTKTSYTCPHGRPVKVEISLEELEKMFKRR